MVMVALTLVTCAAICGAVYLGRRAADWIASEMLGNVWGS